MGKHKQIDRESLTLPAQIEQLAAAPAFSGAESLALAGRQVMAKHLLKLYGHLPGVLSGDDPHDIHQMRVATRRLRASLASTAPAYRAQLVSKLYQRLRKLARALGEVRDRDVLLIRLRNASTETEEQHGGLRQAIEQLQVERDAAHAALLDQLSRKRTQRLLQELVAFLTAPLSEVQANDDGLPLLVHHHAGSAIWRHYEAIRRFETAMPYASSERLHELRIACKHLRYTLELFEPALGENARSLIKQVTAMQEHLGDLHDADVALAYFGDEPTTTITPPAEPAQDEDGTLPAAEAIAAQNGNSADSDSDTAAQIYTMPEGQQADAGGIDAHIQSRRAEREALLTGVQPLWQKLSGDTTRHKLATLLAAL